MMRRPDCLSVYFITMCNGECGGLVLEHQTTNRGRVVEPIVSLNKTLMYLLSMILRMRDRGAENS